MFGGMHGAHWERRTRSEYHCTEAWDFATWVFIRKAFKRFSFGALALCVYNSIIDYILCARKLKKYWSY